MLYDYSWFSFGLLGSNGYYWYDVIWFVTCDVICIHLPIVFYVCLLSCFRVLGGFWSFVVLLVGVFCHCGGFLSSCYFVSCGVICIHLVTWNSYDWYDVIYFYYLWRHMHTLIWCYMGTYLWSHIHTMTSC